MPLNIKLNSNKSSLNKYIHYILHFSPNAMIRGVEKNTPPESEIEYSYYCTQIHADM